MIYHLSIAELLDRSSESLRLTSHKENEPKVESFSSIQETEKTVSSSTQQISFPSIAMMSPPPPLSPMGYPILPPHPYPYPYPYPNTFQRPIPLYAPQPSTLPPYVMQPYPPPPRSPSFVYKSKAP
jgi:hypothetical protein